MDLSFDFMMYHKPIPELTEETIKRFWSHVDIRGPDDCWEYDTLFANGYGRFYLTTNNAFKANRISYAIANGDPGNLLVCHTCDTPRCVNPSHLWVGTDQDNCDDKTDKGRQSRGTTQPSSKLTEEQVKEILASNETLKVLSARYNVTIAIISRIRTNKDWKHIEGKRGTPVRSSTGFKGVTQRSSGRYMAKFTYQYKEHYVGIFATIPEATKAIVAKKAELGIASTPS